MADTLEYEIKVPRNELDTALDSGIKKSFSLEGALTTALGVFGGGVALKGLDLLKDGLNEVVDFALDSVKAFSEQEDALNRLGQALRASGEFSQLALGDLSSFAQGLSRISKFGDEVIVSQLAVAKSFGATNEQSKQLVQAAANLSATFGGGLEENVDKLGKTLNGNLGKLAQYIPELKNLTKEQLAAGEAARIVNEKFSGASASQLDSFSGRVHSLSEAYDDVKKAIGGFIVESDALKDSQSSLVFIFQSISDALNDFKVAQDRQKAGFKESQDSIDQLKRKYEELQLAALDLEQTIIKPATNMDNTAVFIAKKQLQELNAEIATTKGQLDSAKASLEQQKSTEPTGSTGKPLDTSIVEARKKTNDEILFLDQQLILDKNNLDLERANNQIVNDQVRQQAELQRITDFNLTKTELEFQLKEQELTGLQDGEDKRLALLKLAKEKELALSKIGSDSQVKQDQLRLKGKQDAIKAEVALEQQKSAQIAGIIGISTNVLSTIAKEGSRELFLITKASALAQAVVAANLAVLQALALPVDPVTKAAAVTTAKIQGALAVSAIAASAIKGFAQGGIIGDKTQGATPGPDNTTISARSGEMVLNAPQQRQLFDAINSGGMFKDIVINVDGREIARVVRDQMKQGFKFA